MDFYACISKWVIPVTETSGCFGPGSKIIGYQSDSKRKGEDQFCSTVQFVQLNVNVNDVIRHFNVVIKFPPVSQFERQILRSKSLFENEILMYSKILPMIEIDGIVQEMFCKYYCGAAEPNKDDEDFIMVEDLSWKHYKLSSQRVFLDYDHCVLALKEIGRFHGLSYAAKEKFPLEFLAAVSKIKDKWDVDKLKSWKHKFLLCGHRGVLPIINKGQSVALLERFLKNYDDPVKFYLSLVKPVEPEAVLCHGDFCRNNMFFHYNDEGKPTAIKFFDLQTSRYSSPVIDLSFFLFMNTDKETRDRYWDDFLNIYKTSVKSVVPHITVPELDFKRVAIYGFLHCSFFLPIMLGSENWLSFDELWKHTTYEQGVLMSQFGGEYETQALVDVIEFLLKKDMIQPEYF